jgi:uncharacterized membrane protein
MQSRVKLFGHPIHQMLVPIPLGLLVMAIIFDLIWVFSDYEGLAFVSFWNIVAGISGGLIAAIFGLLDFLQIPANTRAKRIGLLHGAGNVLLVALFLISAISRYDNPGYLPSTGIVFLEVLALVLGAVTGWLGGELVDRLGVGVDDGAHLDAPSSLTRKQARATPQL